MGFIQEYYAQQGVDIESVKRWRSRNKRALEKLEMRDQQVENVDNYVTALRNKIKTMDGYFMYWGLEIAVGSEKIYEMMIMQPHDVAVTGVGETEVGETIERHFIATYQGYTIVVFLKEILRLVERLNYKDYPVWQTVRLKKNTYYSRWKNYFNVRNKYRNEFVIVDRESLDTARKVEPEGNKYVNLNREKYVKVRLIASGNHYYVRASELMSLWKTEEEILADIARECETEMKRRIKLQAATFLGKQKADLTNLYRDSIKQAATIAREIDSLDEAEWVESYYQNFQRGIDSIRDHVLCERVEVDEGMVVTVHTKDIVATDEDNGNLWYCGKYIITIDILGKQARGRSLYLDWSTAHHPHISSGRGAWGWFCMWDKAAPVVSWALAKMKPNVVFFALMELLCSYSPRNPYVQMPVLDERLRRSSSRIEAREMFKVANPDIVLVNR